MTELKENEVITIKKMIESEFPDDPALQQIHIARKIITKEAKDKGLSFFEYVKLMGEKIRDIKH